MIVEVMEDILDTLARISNTGHIGILIFCTTGSPSWMNDVNLADVRKAWKISEQVGFLPKRLMTRVRPKVGLFEGGMSVDPLMEEEVEERWQNLLHFAQTG